MQRKKEQSIFNIYTSLERRSSKTCQESYFKFWGFVSCHFAWSLAFTLCITFSVLNRNLTTYLFYFSFVVISCQIRTKLQMKKSEKGSGQEGGGQKRHSDGKNQIEGRQATKVHRRYAGGGGGGQIYRRG